MVGRLGDSGLGLALVFGYGDLRFRIEIEGFRVTMRGSRFSFGVLVFEGFAIQVEGLAFELKDWIW